jgi:hypothetical protein
MQSAISPYARFHHGKEKWFCYAELDQNDHEMDECVGPDGEMALCIAAQWGGD